MTKLIWDMNCYNCNKIIAHGDKYMKISFLRHKEEVDEFVDDYNFCCEKCSKDWQDRRINTMEAK
jgi:hypothetical protein